MTPAFSPANRQESPADMYQRRALPLALRVMMWVVKMMLRRGMLPTKAILRRLEAARPGPKRNRHLRRARAACYRRVMRQALKGRRLPRSAYTPKAHAHHSFAMQLPQGVSFARFQSLYAMCTGGDRARVFGLSSAHEITATGSECGGRSPIARRQSLSFNELNNLISAGRAPP